MTRHRLLPALAAATVALAAGYAGAAYAAAPTPISGPALSGAQLLGGELFFARQGVTAADGDTRWRLTVAEQDGSGSRDLPYRQRERITDLDAGLSTAGRPVLLLSRCASGRCRVRTVDPASGRESAMRAADHTGSSQTSPTQWGNTLAWVDTAGGRSSVMVRDLSSGRPARRVFGPAATATTIFGLDASPRGLAFRVLVPLGDGQDQRVYVKPTGRPVRLLQRVVANGESNLIVGTPRWAGSDLLWAYGRSDEAPTGVILRAHVTTASTTFTQTTPAPGPSDTWLDEVAVDPLHPQATWWLSRTAVVGAPDGVADELAPVDPGTLAFTPACRQTGVIPGKPVTR